MCTTCGCGSDDAAEAHRHLDHPYRPRLVGRQTDAEPGHLRRVRLERDLLAANNEQARANREQLAQAGVLALNLVSSPGSGKTTLLVKTIKALHGRLPIVVIEGDQQTERDAERIRASGAPALQINTGKGCHLDARMVAQALPQLPLAAGGVLMIENVGNLVCPAAFDLGEDCKVVLFSVTEGEDKPLKYPDMFRAATLMLLTKCDLLPHLQFDVAQAITFARQVNPALEVLQLSATSGEGFSAWLDWVEQRTPKPSLSEPKATTWRAVR